MSKLSNVELHLVDSLEAANACKRWLSERRRILAVDTETGGLNWWRDDLRLVQLGDERHGWAIPWHGWGGLARELLESYDGWYVLQNAKFDDHFLRQHGVQLDRRKIADTRLMAHLVDTDSPTGLKAVATRLVDSTASLGDSILQQVMSKAGWTWATVPIDFEPYWSYGALDTVLTAHVFAALAGPARAHRELYDIEMAVQWLIADMEQRGVRIDRHYLEAGRLPLLEEARALRAQMADEYGIENLGSSDQLAAALQRDGWQPTVLTETGKPSMTKEVLATIDHPLARSAVHVRHLEKMVGSYFDNLLDLADDDVVHAKVNPIGARTGRMSIQDPALQTLPRDDPVVRDAFVPREGNRLLLVDYDQMELRLLAHFAGEDALLAAIHEDRDLHTYTAQLVFQLGGEQPSKQQRQLAKNAGFAKIYGSGVDKFAQTVGISTAEARDFLAGYDATYPKVRAFQRLVERVAYDRFDQEGVGYVTSPFGRRHVINNRQVVYKLVNYLIQGTGADLLKIKMLELAAQGLDEYMVLPVHDELVFDVPADQLADVQHAATRTMEERHRFRAPLTVGADVVDRWGDKYR